MNVLGNAPLADQEESKKMRRRRQNKLLYTKSNACFNLFFFLLSYL